MISTGLCCINLILLIKCDCRGWPSGRGNDPCATVGVQQQTDRRTGGRGVDYVAMLATSVLLACMAYMLTHFLFLVSLWFSANMMFAGCSCLAG